MTVPCDLRLSTRSLNRSMNWLGTTVEPLGKPYKWGGMLEFTVGIITYSPIPKFGLVLVKWSGLGCVAPL